MRQRKVMTPEELAQRDAALAQLIDRTAEGMAPTKTPEYIQPEASMRAWIREQKKLPRDQRER